MENESVDYAAEVVKVLFAVYEAGKLDNYIRREVRILTRLAVRGGDINGNVFDISKILSYVAWLRDRAARSTPSGQIMGATRSEIEAHLGEPVDWNEFFGLDKNKNAE